MTLWSEAHIRAAHGKVVDELTFRSYAHNRMMFPEVEPEQWALIFPNVPEMEERFLKQFVSKLFEGAAEIDEVN